MHETKEIRTLYINNIFEKIKLEDLKKSLHAVFSQFGCIHIFAKKNLRMRGQAFVVFRDQESAKTALNTMQGFPFYEKPLRIQFAKIDSDFVTKMNGTYVERPKVPRSSVNDKKKNRILKEQQAALLKVKSFPVPGSMVHNLVPDAKKPTLAVPPIVEEPPNKILFLNNLPQETNEMMLTILFKQFPGYKEVRLVPNRHDIAFVEFENEVSASAAKTSLQGFKLTPTHPVQITFAIK